MKNLFYLFLMLLIISCGKGEDEEELPPAPVPNPLAITGNCTTGNFTSSQQQQACIQQLRNQVSSAQSLENSFKQYTYLSFQTQSHGDRAYSKISGQLATCYNSQGAYNHCRSLTNQLRSRLSSVKTNITNSAVGYSLVVQYNLLSAKEQALDHLSAYFGMYPFSPTYCNRAAFSQAGAEQYLYSNYKPCVVPRN